MSKKESCVETENRITSLIEYKATLNESDLLRIGEYLVGLYAEEARLIMEKKTQASKYAALLKQNEADRERLIINLRDKEEIREEECLHDYDYESGVLNYISVDSGEVVSSRKITNEERQLNLFDKKDLEESEPKAPVCHMKPMFLISEDGGTLVYRCQTCTNIITREDKENAAN